MASESRQTELPPRTCAGRHAGPLTADLSNPTHQTLCQLKRSNGGQSDGIFGQIAAKIPERKTCSSHGDVEAYRSCVSVLLR